MKRIGIGIGIRWIALSITALMTITSCSHDEVSEIVISPTKAAIELEYWTPFSGGDNQFMTEMVEKFNQDQDDILIVQMNSRLDDYYSRLRTAILSGNAPDIAIIHTTSMTQFVQNGYIEDVTGIAEQVGLKLSQLNTNILESTQFNGNTYAVPLDTHGLVMYYNKEYLRLAGVLDEASGEPIIAAGEAGFKQFLQKIKAAVPPDIAPLAMPSTRIDSVWLWWSLYNQMDAGGYFYNSIGKANFNNASAQQALNFVYSLYKEELITPHINDAFQLFYDGKAAVAFLGMWGTGAFENSSEVELGVVTVPVLYDHPAQWGDSHSLAIPTKSDMTEEKKRAALVFSKWMVEHGELWAQAGHVPSMSKVVESEAFNKLPYRSDYAAAADHVAYWPRHQLQWSIIEILTSEFERLIYGEQTVQETLKQAELRVNAALGE